MAVRITVNKDGSTTTELVDEDIQPAEPKEAEAKVVKAPAKAAPKASATAEKK